LQKLQDSGALEKLILTGSWCQYYYRILFNASPEIPLIRTTDIDFLVPNPPKISKSVDITKILNDLGFDNDFDYYTGLLKYVHPDLEIQFITPALGRGKSRPYEIEKYNINAEGLRYLKLLQDFKFQMKHENITLWLPEPEAFFLQKILTSQKRKNEAKKIRDLSTAKIIGELCLYPQDHNSKMKIIFNSLPLKWQMTILHILKELSFDLYDFLK
jgi:hypothetical protein